ncbi:hypothetical protein PU634_10395 [Oceanimonas pelagia]|uniref:Uncharacterized protein n=1 Tax=Oceanimonas pelagia TaxID=3028314 RepID=A0AA50KKL7_9GAMM|nr:hypothetical protein [Oceanimonas pelagia]WMC09525.1 hypothetical protein PU634_10395 [Oceanimonas pelagia]
MTMTAISAATAATAFVNYEGSELFSAFAARVSLAVLRKQCDDNLAMAADAINEAAQAANAEARRFWLQPNGEKVRTTKHLKSHHKRYWMTAGKIIAATEGKADVHWSALPESLEADKIQEWIEFNGLAGMTMEMVYNAIGMGSHNGKGSGSGKGSDSDKAAGEGKKVTANGKASNGSGDAVAEANQAAGAEAAKLEQWGTMVSAIGQELENILTEGRNMPGKSAKDLKALVSHYETKLQAMVDQLNNKG